MADKESKSIDQMVLFRSKSCRGVSFEMKVSVERVLEINNSPTDPVNRRLTEPSRARTTSFDYDFGQIPTDDEGLFGDPETGSLDEASTRTLEGTAAQEKPVKKRIPTPGLGAILLELCSQLTVYKFLLLVCIALNVFGGLLAATNLFPYAKANPSLFAIGNILMLVLVRNEVLLRVFFWIIVKIFGHSFIPLGFKYTVTSLMQSLGGIHSGCGVSAVIWVMYALTRIFRLRHSTPTEILVVACGICFLLLLSCIGAFPLLRMLHHNVFERVHRFAGWTCLALIWIFIILSYGYDPSNHKYSVSVRLLLKRQVVWFTGVTTFLIILPWLFLRKVPVEAVVTDSKNVTLLNLSGGIKPGILTRISPSPLSEWHAFGIISDGRKRHTIIAGAVGDFTKGLVKNPPEYLWVRTFYFTGLPFLVNLYNRVLLVATGSGVGIYLSFIMQPTKPDVHVIWIANSIQKTYGDDIYKVVTETAPEKITVFDTATLGSRSMMKEMVIKKALEWEAEVVVVTSNPRGTREFVTSCRAAGIAAFGPIWDS